MNKKLRETLDELLEYPTKVKQAFMLTKGEEDIIDVIGTVKANERRYKDTIRGAVAEVDLTPNVPRAGERHAAEVKREAARSYNTPNLMTKLQGAGFTLMDLIEHDVIRVSWQWRNLERFCKARGIELSISSEHEVSEMGKEEHDIGQIWSTSKYPRWT